MYNGINEMIDDLMEHISLENNVLFPRALAGNKNPAALALTGPTTSANVGRVSVSATGNMLNACSPYVSYR